MTGNKHYRLCGGTFFTLLITAKKQTAGYSQRFKGVRSGLTEAELLYALAKVMQPDLEKWMNSEEKTIRDNTRDFKVCENWGGGYFRFNDSAVRKSFDDRIRKDYKTALMDMCDLVDYFIDRGTSSRKDEYLVKAIIEVLADDDEIPDDQEFLVGEDGGSFKKSDILKAKIITLEPFLLGIWHYVITGIDDNNVGMETVNEWCPSRDRAKREYTADLGENSTRGIEIRYIEHDSSEETNIKESSHENDEKTETDEQETIVFDDASTESEGESINQTVNNPFVFNFTQHGNNNTQIGHIEHYHKGGGENDE